MKKLIKAIVFKLFGQKGIDCCRRLKYVVPNSICALFPMHAEIIFESHPDFADNTFELYRYMLKQGLQEKYKLSWLVNNPEQYKNRTDIYGDLIEINPTTFFGRAKKYYRCNRAKVFIGCNRHIVKDNVSKHQFNFYLGHGLPLKDCRKFTRYGSTFSDYVVIESKFFVKYRADVLGVDKSKVIPLGTPRNDQLYGQYDTLKNLYSDVKFFSKIIVWVPTFKKFKDGTRIDCHFDYPLGLSVIYDEENAKQFNDFLKVSHVLVILKPHPAQDLGVIKNLHLSNFRILTDKEMLTAGIQTNELLAQTDAMIGDYSGIYYDYLLLDKPVGITLDDYDRYRQDMGFLFDNPLDILVGEYIYNLEDMVNFVDMVVRNEDRKFKERNKIKLLTHDYLDGNSTKRTYEFLVNEMKKRGFKI